MRMRIERSAAEALKKLDEVKHFIEVNGSDHLNMIFNELTENVEEMIVFIELFDIMVDLFECNESSKRPINSFRCFDVDRGRIT